MEPQKRETTPTHNGQTSFVPATFSTGPGGRQAAVFPPLSSPTMMDEAGAGLALPRLPALAEKEKQVWEES